MLKRLLSAISLSSLCLGSLYAECCAPEECSCPAEECCSVPRECCWFFGGGASACIPQEKEVRNAFGNVWANYQAFLGYSFCWPLDLLATVNFTHKSGKIQDLRARVDILPIGLELRYRYYACDELTLFLGLAPRYYLTRMTYQGHHYTQNGAGGALNTGVTWNPCNNIFIDLYIAYSYQSKHSFDHAFKGDSLMLGGLDAGASVHWTF